MKLVIETNLLQDLLLKAVKGAGLSKLAPITNMIEIDVTDGVMRLHTTDKRHHLFVNTKNIQCDEGCHIVIELLQFQKLISKMTCKQITLSTETVENTKLLKVKGNGEYTLTICVDEMGNDIMFPDPSLGFQTENTFILERKDIMLLLDHIKPSLATTFEQPCYTGYYIGKRIIATDSCNLAGVTRELFEGEELLMYPELIDILTISTDDSLKVGIIKKQDNSQILFEGSDFKLYGETMTELEDYEKEAVAAYIDENMPHMCKIQKNVLLEALDRLTLFVGPYDNNCVQLIINANELQVISRANDGHEVIPVKDYVGTDATFSCLVDVFMLITELKALPSEEVSFQYGSDVAIKFVDKGVEGDLNIVVSLTVEGE